MKTMDKGALTNVDMKKLKYKILYICIFVFIALCCVISFVPVFWVLLSGFKDVREIYAVPASFFPKKIDLSKVGKVWSEMKFYKYYANTFVMTIGSVIMDLIVSGFAGYVISRLQPKGTKVVLTIIFWIMLMPGTMRTVPLYMEFKSLPILGINLLETYWPIWLMAGANAFNIILFKNFFDGISKSLIEAAWIDGCSDIRLFFEVIIPLSVPVFITVATFGFNAQFGQFFWPYLLISSKEKSVIGLQIYKMKASTYTLDYQMLALIFSIAPQILVFAVLQKYIVGGVSVGGVKG
ncbi:MAG: carbohydrate ABC transporter permease [Firmicutes bacterium]|nr:carbohydrate ABC transporter permease [Bacillota bacterium]